MHLSSRRKALAGVLALGLVALIADRFFSGPAPARAQPTQPATNATLPKASSGPAPAVAHASGPSDPPLLHRMQALADGIDLQHAARLDAFKPPAEWLPPPPPPVEEEPEPEPQDDHAARFKRQHKLSAVLTGPAGDCAVIGGRTLTVGQTLDGFVLVGISARAVTFRSSQAEVVLALPDPGIPDNR